MDGQQIGSRYVIDSLLGERASGYVWSGRDHDGGVYAIKLLRKELSADPELVNRFVGERCALQSIRDPHVVQVHDLVVEGSTLAIVMDLIDGADLRSVLRSERTLAPATIARWGAQVAGALAAAHAGGVVHRDVKPENILIDEIGQSWLTDFGVASILDGAHHSTMMVGTPHYMAPEIAEGKPPAPTADLYSLGVTLYELCCGVPPFAGRGNAMAVLRAHQQEVPGRPAGVPDVLWEIIAGLLNKDPLRRGGPARSIRDRLTGLVDELDGLAAGPWLSKPPPIERVITPPPGGLAGVNVPTMARGVSAIPAFATAGGTPGYYPPGVSGGWATPAPGSVPGYAAPIARKRSLVGPGILVAALVAGVAGGVFLVNRDNAGERNSTSGTSSGGGSQVVAATQLETPAGSVPPTAAPSTAAPSTAPTVLATYDAARPQPASGQAPAAQVPSAQVASQAIAPAGNSIGRQRQAEAVIHEYLGLVRSRSLSRSDLDRYYADSVQWYGGSSPLSRDQLWQKVKPGPSATQQTMTIDGTRNFRAGVNYSGYDADVLSIARTVNRPNAASRQIIVNYTLVYDRPGQRPRIAKVTES